MEHFFNMQYRENIHSGEFEGSAIHKLHRTFFPIRRHELQTFIPTFFMFFLLTFTYDILRILKSTLVVGESDVGAEMIPFLKVWAVIPGAFLATTVLIKVSHKFTREKIFYFVLSFFLLFFSLFLFYLYPQRQLLEARSLGAFLAHYLPSGAQGFIAMIIHWPLAIFYVVTELWGSVLLSMLIWGYVNEITEMDQASRFYPLFLLGSNSAAIFAGLFSVLFSSKTFTSYLSYGQSDWERSIFFYLMTGILCSLLIMYLIYYIHLHLPKHSHKSHSQKDEIKLSLVECLRCLKKSKHLLLISVLVLSYNLVFNLSDILWEDQLKELYHSDSAGMAQYKSIVTLLTGGLSVFISLFVSGFLVRRLGWKYAAYVTPCILMSTCFAFFWLILFQDSPWTKSIIYCFTSHPLELILLFGSIQIVFSRGCKYTLFDTSKEMAYIPLSTMEKRYGKAAIDGVGSRIGKSAGSLLIQALLMTYGSLSAAVPFLAFFILLILFFWFLSVKNLSDKLPI